jgi:hypothetical protein
LFNALLHDFQCSCSIWATNHSWIKDSVKNAHFAF